MTSVAISVSGPLPGVQGSTAKPTVSPPCLYHTQHMLPPLLAPHPPKNNSGRPPRFPSSDTAAHSTVQYSTVQYSTVQCINNGHLGTYSRIARHPPPRATWPLPKKLILSHTIHLWFQEQAGRPRLSGKRSAVLKHPTDMLLYDVALTPPIC